MEWSWGTSWRDWGRGGRLGDLRQIVQNGEVEGGKEAGLEELGKGRRKEEKSMPLWNFYSSDFGESPHLH